MHMDHFEDLVPNWKGNRLAHRFAEYYPECVVHMRQHPYIPLLEPLRSHRLLRYQDLPIQRDRTPLVPQ